MKYSDLVLDFTYENWNFYWLKWPFLEWCNLIIVYYYGVRTQSFLCLFIHFSYLLLCYGGWSYFCLVLCKWPVPIVWFCPKCLFSQHSSLCLTIIFQWYTAVYCLISTFVLVLERPVCPFYFHSFVHACSFSFFF